MAGHRRAVEITLRLGTADLPEKMSIGPAARHPRRSPAWPGCGRGRRSHGRWLLHRRHWAGRWSVAEAGKLVMIGEVDKPGFRPVAFVPRPKPLGHVQHPAESLSWRLAVLRHRPAGEMDPVYARIGPHDAEFDVHRPPGRKNRVPSRFRGCSPPTCRSEPASVGSVRRCRRRGRLSTESARSARRHRDSGSHRRPNRRSDRRWLPEPWLPATAVTPFASSAQKETVTGNGRAALSYNILLFGRSKPGLAHAPDVHPSGRMRELWPAAVRTDPKSLASLASEPYSSGHRHSPTLRQTRKLVRKG